MDIMGDTIPPDQGFPAEFRESFKYYYNHRGIHAEYGIKSYPKGTST